MRKIKETTKKYLAEIKEIKPINFIFLLAAGIINAFGVTLFLFPVKLYDSGVSGLSMLLDQVTPAYLNISFFLIVINFPIFIFGMKKQGINFTLYSLFTIGIYSLFSYLIMNVFPIDVSLVSPLAGEDLLLCAIFGGVISGVGSGLTIRFGGAIDGIDVLSVVFAKKTIVFRVGRFSVANVVMAKHGEAHSSHGFHKPAVSADIFAHAVGKLKQGNRLRFWSIDPAVNTAVTIGAGKTNIGYGVIRHWVLLLTGCFPERGFLLPLKECRGFYGE